MKDHFCQNQHKPYGIYERFLKRSFDLVLSLGALLVLFPLICIVAIMVRIKLGSPVLFVQERPGKNEKIFRIYKFRTMTDKKDSNGFLLRDKDRLTPFGKKLRSTSLDELPELINIIKGDMAIVGPRPLHVSYIPWYTNEQHKRHLVRPGLTGYAQAHGRNAVNWDERLKMDVDYTDKITFCGDVRIVFDTVKAVIKREGINSETSESSATVDYYFDYCKEIGRKPENYPE